MKSLIVSLSLFASVQVFAAPLNAYYCKGAFEDGVIHFTQTVHTTKTIAQVRAAFVAQLNPDNQYLQYNCMDVTNFTHDEYRLGELSSFRDNGKKIENFFLDVE